MSMLSVDKKNAGIDAQSSCSVVVRILVPTLVPALTSLCLGYDMGMMSGAVFPITRHFNLSDWAEGFLVGCLNLTAAVGTLLGSWLVDRWGRVYGIRMTVILLLLGPLIAATSVYYETLLLGRLVIGIGGGLSLVTAPVYASELAPPQHRGMIICTIAIAENAGTLLGYFAAMVVTIPHIGKDVGWRIAMGLAGLPAVLAMMQMGLLLESPRWLLKNDRRDEAVQVLDELMQKPGTDELQAAVTKMEEDIRAAQQEASWREIMCPSKPVFRMLLAGVGCVFFSANCRYGGTHLQHC
jgi:MFS family permease